MVITHLSRGKAILAGLVTGVFSLLVTTFATALPAHAASTIQVDWTSARSVHLSGSALKSPIDLNGDFYNNVAGSAPGSQYFLASSVGPVDMSFGCKVSLTVEVAADSSGTFDYSKGSIAFMTSSPSTCSNANLTSNINGVQQDPANTSMLSLPVTIGSVDKRVAGPVTGGSGPQTVDVTAGMGSSSNYNNIPQTDTFLLCSADGSYANKLDALVQDCLAQNSAALSAPPLKSGNLTDVHDNKGPGAGDEKAWTGQFTNVKPGNYEVCSANLKACQLFTKNADQAAKVYVTYGSTPGSVIPGTPPGKGDDQKVCTTGDGLAGALAWVLCPAIQLIATATQFFENNIIVPFLTTSPLTTNPDNPVYILWQDVRNFANIGFILFFFVVIFSQATSIGLSNYGIKRVLPRMALVVVGVNLSYFIAAFILDAFNIFGAGVSQLVTAALQQAGTQQLNTGTSAGPTQMFFLGGAALVTVVATGGAAIGWFFSFLGLAFLVVIVAVGILMVRQYYILGEVIASPLLILAMMLPNLAGAAKKELRRGFKVLAMYPIIVLLFALGDILGFILSQPDFKITGDGVNDQVAQAVRVFLQFLARVLPLVLIPGAFAASGTALEGASRWARGRVSSRAGQLRQDASQMAGEARMRVARSKWLPGINKVAGMGLRRNYVREQRQRNLAREQEEYVAGQAGSSAWMRRQAAGVAGRAGQTRAAAYAANTAAKGRNEDIDAEMSLLNDEMRRLAIDPKNFAAEAGRYFQDPNGTRADGTRKSVIYGSNGQEFDISKNQNMQRALLNSAASQGEVAAVESARLNSNLDQTMVDDIIRRNDGKLKEKGGYHLATNFSLANGRNFDLSSPAGVNAAKTEMLQQRFGTMAASGANSIAGMKGGLLGDTADMVKTATGPAPGAGASQADIDKYNMAHAAFNGMSAPDKQKMFDRFDEIVKNPNTLNRSEGADALRDMHTIMTGQGFRHS